MPYRAQEIRHVKQDSGDCGIAIVLGHPEYHELSCPDKDEIRVDEELCNGWSQFNLCDARLHWYLTGVFESLFAWPNVNSIADLAIIVYHHRSTSNSKTSPTGSRRNHWFNLTCVSPISLDLLSERIVLDCLSNYVRVIATDDILTFMCLYHHHLSVSIVTSNGSFINSV